MTMAFLTSDPIELAPLTTAVESPGRGAVVSFLGVVRNHHRDRAVQHLHYWEYGPMAEAECARIVAEAESRWQVAVAVRHRTGRLEVGETAVAIVAASAHRDDAFAACRWVIEEVKRRVPIWKHEFYADGSMAWVDPTVGSAMPVDATAQSV
jgi:molybdopterin synthase catalytic subunit